MSAQYSSRLGPTVAGSLAALALVAGCGAGILPGVPAGTGPVAAPAAGAAATDPGSSVCSLLSPAEVQAVIGIAPEGDPLFNGRACQWQDSNDTRNRTLTIEIKEPGSAPNGRLPPLDEVTEMRALPDGMARDLLGRVYFVCGASSECIIGVTGQGTSAEGRIDADLKAGVALVPTVRAKTG